MHPPARNQNQFTIFDLQFSILTPDVNPSTSLRTSFAGKRTEIAAAFGLAMTPAIPAYNMRGQAGARANRPASDKSGGKVSGSVFRHKSAAISIAA